MKISIRINAEECSRCFICTRVCPNQSLSIINDEISINHEFCISCGHCAAVCPTGCITPFKENPFSVGIIPSELPDAQRIFHEKRSVREFKRTPLPVDLLKQLAAYAEKAPSAHNARTRSYFIITDPSKINELEEAAINQYRKLDRLLNSATLKLISILQGARTDEDLSQRSDDFKNMLQRYDNGDKPIFRNAPCVICIAAPADNTVAKDDCVAAQHYMMLFGHTQGLGSCVIGYAQYVHKQIEKHLNIPSGYKIYAVSIFGYPLYKYKKEIIFENPARIHFIGS
jgi:nitroreductase/NAD-dependent dihydropyrimidine dehydrogenase PreA subunit